MVNLGRKPEHTPRLTHNVNEPFGADKRWPDRKYISKTMGTHAATEIYHDKPNVWQSRWPNNTDAKSSSPSVWM